MQTFSCLQYLNNFFDYRYTVNGLEFRQPYFLVDGIYPELSRFVKTISEPTTLAEKQYVAWQESARKDVERAFGVFKRKFKYVSSPVEEHHREDINDVTEACLLLHNWMVMERVHADEEEGVYWYEHPTDPTGTVDDLDEVDRVDDEMDDLLRERAEVDLRRNLMEAFYSGTATHFASEEQRRMDSFLPLKYQLVNQRWKNLYDAEKHMRLRKALIGQVSPLLMEDERLMEEEPVEEDDGGWIESEDSSVEEEDV